jgi:hypothetical protein
MGICVSNFRRYCVSKDVDNLIKLKPHDIHIHEYTIEIYRCYAINDIEFVALLRTNFPEHFRLAMRQMLTVACYKGEDIKMIYEKIGSEYIDSKTLEACFRRSCIIGHLENAKWIYSLGVISHEFIHKDSGNLVKGVCYSGRMDVLKWLHTFEEFEDYDIMILYSLLKGNIELAFWLNSIRTK